MHKRSLHLVKAFHLVLKHKCDVMRLPDSHYAGENHFHLHRTDVLLSNVTRGNESIIRKFKLQIAYQVSNNPCRAQFFLPSRLLFHDCSSAISNTLYIETDLANQASVS